MGNSRPGINDLAGCAFQKLKPGHIDDVDRLKTGRATTEPTGCTRRKSGACLSNSKSIRALVEMDGIALQDAAQMRLADTIDVIEALHVRIDPIRRST